MGLIRNNLPADVVAEPAPQPDAAALEPTALAEHYRALDRDQRRQMVKTLAVAPHALDFVVEQARTEVDPLLSQTLFDCLIAIARLDGMEKAAVTAVLGLLRDGDAGVRSHAVGLLSAFPETTGAIMPDLLQDPSTDVRLYALDILQHLVHPGVPRWLNDVLDRECHPNVMASAIDRSLEIGSTGLATRIDDIAARFAGTPFIQFALTLAGQRLSGITQ